MLAEIKYTPPSKEKEDPEVPNIDKRRRSLRTLFSLEQNIFFLEHKLLSVHLTWLHLVYEKILFFARHPHLMVYVEFFLYNIILDNCQKVIFVNFLLTNGMSTINV